MFREVDYLIVGSGLTGSVLARLLHDAGNRVLILERRTHVGGNVHDHLHESGIRIHTYGPHYFRTSSERIWEFVQRYASFYQYEATLLSKIDDRYEQWPVTAEYIQEVVGNEWTPSFRGTPTNFEEASLSKMPRTVYEQFVKGYTEKQWGIAASMLSAGLASRFEVGTKEDPRLKKHRFQGIPTEGYAAFMRSLIEGIPLLTGVNFLHHRQEFFSRKLTIYTGPIDEYFSHSLGKLEYRGQLRHHRYLPQVPYALPGAQVNYPSPQDGSKIRALEWKRMMQPGSIESIQGTVITEEVPCSPLHADNYEYPFPDERNQKLYNEYRALALTEPKTFFCGRLGEYRYFDMDQAIARAFMFAERIIAQDTRTSPATLLKEVQEVVKEPLAITS